MRFTAKLVISCLIGNILEFYDFILYGVFATVIAQHFFPSMNYQAKLMSVFTVLAIGYLARPLGGLLFGHFGDKYSRRKTLIVSLLIMGFATALIGLIPSYASIGITATVFLVVLRLIQGLTVGGESSGSMVFLLEHAQEKWRASLSICSLLGAVIGVLLALYVSKLIAELYSPERIVNGVWRLPFLLSAVLAILGCYLRSRFWGDAVVESVKLPIKELFRKQTRDIIRAVLFLALPAVFTGFSTVYLVPYLMTYLHFTLGEAVVLNSWLMLTMFLCLLLSAYLADRLQCYKKWVAMTLAMSIVFIYPLFSIVQQSHHMAVFAFIALTSMISITMGPEIVLLAGFFKKSVRYSGVGFSHGFAFSIIAGTSPLVFNYLAMRYGVFAVTYYLIFAACISLGATITAKTPGPF